MTRYITNDQIERHFSIEDYLPTAEVMYRELGLGRASCMPTSTTHTRVEDTPETAAEPAFHAMRTTGGAIKEFNVAAIRLNSDIKHWPEKHGEMVQERIPIRDGKYNGLVFLFSTETGELLSIFPDGLIQTYHVAGGIAMSAKYLSRGDVTTLGMFGTGHQARTHLQALDFVFDLEMTTVYSPTEKHRHEFVNDMSEKVSCTIQAVDSPREVCSADVINCATNSSEPVFEADWIEPGTHIGYIRPNEIPNELLNQNSIDVFAISTVDQKSKSITGATGFVSERQRSADHWNFYPIEAERLSPKLRSISEKNRKPSEEDFLRLPELMVDESLGRTSSDDITVFRQIGDGVAFTAIGHKLHEIAEENDIGEKLPSGRFMQEYVP